MQYEFTLIVDEDATEAPYADALFEAGEGDYVAEGGPCGNLVHVFQEAATLPRSLVIAIRMIEGTGLQVLGVHSDNLVTLQDIADRTGRVAESVRLLAKGPCHDNRVSRGWTKIGSFDATQKGSICDRQHIFSVW